MNSTLKRQPDYSPRNLLTSKIRFNDPFFKWFSSSPRSGLRGIEISYGTIQKVINPLYPGDAVATALGISLPAFSNL